MNDIDHLLTLSLFSTHFPAAFSDCISREGSVINMAALYSKQHSTWCCWVFMVAPLLLRQRLRKGQSSLWWEYNSSNGRVQTLLIKSRRPLGQVVSESAGSNEGTRLLMGQLPASWLESLVGWADHPEQQLGETRGAIRFAPARLSISSWTDDVFNWIKASPREEPARRWAWWAP